MIEGMKKDAQKLLYQAASLMRSDLLQEARCKYQKLSLLHERIAQLRFDQADDLAWVDAFAAITCAGYARAFDRAEDLVADYRQRADGSTNRELNNLQRWLVQRWLGEQQKRWCYNCRHWAGPLKMSLPKGGCNLTGKIMAETDVCPSFERRKADLFGITVLESEAVQDILGPDAALLVGTHTDEHGCLKTEAVQLKNIGYDNASSKE